MSTPLPSSGRPSGSTEHCSPIPVFHTTLVISIMDTTQSTRKCDVVSQGKAGKENSVFCWRLLRSAPPLIDSRGQHTSLFTKTVLVFSLSDAVPWLILRLLCQPPVHGVWIVHRYCRTFMTVGLRIEYGRLSRWTCCTRSLIRLCVADDIFRDFWGCHNERVQ